MKSDIVRTRKDAKYCQSWISEQQAMLPQKPLGTCELSDAELEIVQGGIAGDLTLPALNNAELLPERQLFGNNPQLGRLPTEIFMPAFNKQQ